VFTNGKNYIIINNSFTSKCIGYIAIEKKFCVLSTMKG